MLHKFRILSKVGNIPPIYIATHSKPRAEICHSRNSRLTQAHPHSPSTSIIQPTLSHLQRPQPRRATTTNWIPPNGPLPVQVLRRERKVDSTLVGGAGRSRYVRPSASHCAGGIRRVKRGRHVCVRSMGGARRTRPCADVGLGVYENAVE